MLQTHVIELNTDAPKLKLKVDDRTTQMTTFSLFGLNSMSRCQFDLNIFLLGNLDCAKS